jgi:chromosome segregation protein
LPALAAFLVKPSPFCLLDEADAPLDAANVMRFTRLIREMSSRSQFITITHKTGTMEMADALYGITMDEPGCSRVVSVRLREPTLV